ncbi:hypothetical protein V6B14_12825 [Sporosarcina psychrophila]|uniref:hypothetical protein n=1 Tax=Sporosarcina psychrophila TaxID=1476 RepID=UPI0030CEAF4C
MRKRIGEVIGIGESQAKRFIKRMTDTGMKVKRAKRYYLNPIYFLNGKHVNDELYWLFRTQLNDVLPKGVQDSYVQRRDGGL